MAPREIDAPPVGEEFHLPGPSLIPIINATGLVIALLGLTLYRFLIVVGALIFLVTLVLWIRDSIHDISELPAEHREH